MLLGRRGYAPRLSVGVGLSFLVLCLTGCDTNGYEVEITVPMFQDFAVRIPSFVAPGTRIPDKYSKMDVPVCNIPTEDEIWTLAEQKLGDLGWLATLASNIYTIEKLDLLDSRMTAIVGSFDDLTYVGLVLKPKPLNGDEQPYYDLGAAASDTGLGAEIVLTPPNPVDLMAIMRDEQDNPSTECVRVGAEVHGCVPDGPVSADVFVHVRVTISAPGILTSFPLWLLQLFT